MESALFELGFVFTIAAILGIIGARFKQPPILGYIITGLVLIPIVDQIEVSNVMSIFSTIGIAALLFLIGLELNIREVKEVGRTALIVGIAQIIITLVLGFGVLRVLLKFSITEATIVATALTFSSTIVVVKLLGEKKETNSLHGRIAIGMLIVQDLFAVIALLMLNFIVGSTNQVNANILLEIVKIIGTGLLLLAIAIVVGRLIERLIEHVGKSTELLLVTTIAWFLMFAYITKIFGFSIEVGAFIAGIVLSGSPLSAEIVAKIKPLRDFFIMIFFINLGMHLQLTNIGNNIGIIILLSLMVFLFNPIISMSILGSLGFHRRVSFLTGISLSQISEFSIILINTGVVLGQLDQRILTIITGVAIITLTGSSYLIKGGNRLYYYMSDFLKVFESKRSVSSSLQNSKSQEEVILLGAHRMGRGLLEISKQHQFSMLAIDYDPVVIRTLSEQGLKAIYGDIADPELFDLYDSNSLKVIISTVPGFDENIILLGRIKEFTQKPLIIVRAGSDEEAAELKTLGADYVLVPEYIAGQTIVKILIENGIVKKKES